MYGFKLTKEAARIATCALAEDRKLDIVIKRPEKNVLLVTLEKDGVVIFEMMPYNIDVGGSITITGLRAHLDIEGGM